MNRKGFTLSELLAVIAILAIIVLVAVPTFNKYVINSENEYYKNLENTVKVAGMEFFDENSAYLPKDIGSYYTINQDILYKSGVIENVTDSEGNLCKKVDVYVRKTEDGKYDYETCLECGSYKTNTSVCTGNYNDWETTPEDETGPSVTDIYVSNKTTNSITINAVCNDDESGISQYEYSKDGGVTYVKPENKMSSTYKFDGLTSNNTYYFKVRCSNGAGKQRESKEVNAATPRFTNPSIKLVTTKDGFPRVNEKTGKVFPYSPKRDAEITYNSYNIENSDIRYFLKSTVRVTTNVDVYECVSNFNKNTQNNCNTSAKRTMEPNVWYQTKNQITTSTFATNTDEENHTLYAQIGDGVNLSGATTYTITNIDTKVPTITVISNPKTLGDKDYNFLENVTYTYGFSGGNVVCNPALSLKKGTYPVTCIVTGNNGLTTIENDGKFEVRHNYPATLVPKTCTRDVNCRTEKYCTEHYPCDPWGCTCGSWPGGCCTQYFNSICCDKYVSGTKCDKQNYDCSYYICPNGGQPSGSICYY